MPDIKLVPPPSIHINKDAISLLEEVLARLKSGETEAIAIVEVKRDGMVANTISENSCYSRLCYGISRLFIRAVTN